MKSYFAPISPLGVRIHTDTLPRGKRIRARARWTDPISGVRKSRSITVDNEAFAYEFFSALRPYVGTDLDPFITLTNYADQTGDRFLRGVDMTSTASGYRAGLRLRALPCIAGVAGVASPRSSACGCNLVRKRWDTDPRGERHPRACLRGDNARVPTH